ncbi:MAG TPA: pirin family protein [Ilumatobacteraceae bacterium]|nr:pirin family protein [Ilumatobacteraceae bacterium]
MTSPTIRVLRADERFHTDAGWLDSWHSFNFGHHYHPEHNGHGLLLVHNDDVVDPGQGFPPHPHSDMEIVTWVLSGALEHRDSEGNHGVILPGHAQRMSAGIGIRHSEMNASRELPVHFLQMWVRPDTRVRPSYEQRDLSEALASGELIAIASGQGHDGAVHIHQRGAVLWGARVPAGGSVTVPQAAYVHFFVAVGAGALDGAGALSTGDAVRLTHAGDGLVFTAGDEGAEVLIWATD